MASVRLTGRLDRQVVILDFCIAERAQRPEGISGSPYIWHPARWADRIVRPSPGGFVSSQTTLAGLLCNPRWHGDRFATCVGKLDSNLGSLAMEEVNDML